MAFSSFSMFTRGFLPRVSVPRKCNWREVRNAVSLIHPSLFASIHRYFIVLDYSDFTLILSWLYFSRYSLVYKTYAALAFGSLEISAPLGVETLAPKKTKLSCIHSLHVVTASLSEYFKWKTRRHVCRIFAPQLIAEIILSLNGGLHSMTVWTDQANK